MTNALDRLTAERVMGWPTIDFTQQPPKGGYIRLACAYYGTDHRRRGETFQPSTDPRDTFAVVDALRAEGWRLRLDDLGTHWRAVFGRDDYHKSRKHRGAALCIDRLHAILLAANAVKGASDEEVRAAIKEVA